MARPLLPAFSRIYGIQPWQLELLTEGELKEYVNDLNERARAGPQEGG